MYRNLYSDSFVEILQYPYPGLWHLEETDGEAEEYHTGVEVESTSDTQAEQTNKEVEGTSDTQTEQTQNITFMSR